MSLDKSYLIISSMKNEASFILEWVAYHRVIGFSDFLIYTNDCEDTTVELLCRLQELGLACHEHNEVLRRGPHKSALKYAKEHKLAQEADWILVSDIDEFLVVKVGDGTVQALVSHVPEDTDVIPVTWRLFGNNNIIEYQDVPIIEQFTDAELPLSHGGQPDRFVKSLFRRQDAVGRFGLHGPRGADGHVWRRPNRNKLGPDDNLTRPESDFAYEVAQINHYAVGAVDSFLVKKDRGRANHWRQDLGIDYWKRMCRGGEADNAIHTRLNETKAEMARMLKDPKLRKLHEAGVAWRREKIAELRQNPRFESMRSRIIALAESSSGARSVEEARREPDGKMAQVTVRNRIQELCVEMRTLVDELSPHDAAETAHARLDEIERGLFGKASTDY